MRTYRYIVLWLSAAALWAGFVVVYQHYYTPPVLPAGTVQDVEF